MPNSLENLNNPHGENPYKDEKTFREYVIKNGLPDGHPRGVSLRPGSEYFVGRKEEISKVLDALKAGKSFLVWGESRNGKSSFLNQVIYQATLESNNLYTSKLRTTTVRSGMKSFQHL